MASMAGEDGLKAGAASSGLAVLLSGEEDLQGRHRKSHLISCCDDIRYLSVEPMLEHVFDLPSKSLIPSKRPVDVNFVRSIIKEKRRTDEGVEAWEGVVLIRDQGAGAGVVVLDESSICGELRSVRHPLQVESFGMFSSARANTCVSRGRWMYEVMLETAGVQQLGWATIACPFTDRKGVGDADDSYGFDGRRVRKWNKEAKAYGEPWVVGDVIGCCIDLDGGEISFYRNGDPLGVAFSGVRRSGGDVISYYPAISLSQGERCDLNFGGRPFKYPIGGFLPLQPPPAQSSAATYLFRCLSRVLELQSFHRCDPVSLERLRRAKRFSLLEELFHPISHGICEELFAAIGEKGGAAVEYLAQGLLLPFLLERFSARPPHDRAGLDRAVDLFLEFPESRPLFCHLILALSSSCRTAPLVLLECPYSGSHPYLSLACHILRREELMALWWTSPEYEFSFEGFLSRKSPNKNDLQRLIPSVLRSGSSEETFLESTMMLTTSALAGAMEKIEELQRELCQLVMKFIPPAQPLQSPGSVFRTFVQNLLTKARGADHKLAWSGASNSSNSALLSLYMAILHFLSEGSAPEGISERAGGFLHRGGKRCFPAGILFKADPHRTSIPRLGGSFFHLATVHPASHDEEEEITWEEGCMDPEEAKMTHSGGQKPCCCCFSGADADLMKMLKNSAEYCGKSHRPAACGHISERSSAHVAAECSAEDLNDEIVEKPSADNLPESPPACRPPQRLENLPSTSSSAVLREEELLDALLLLYHLGVSSNFKQAFYYKSHQTTLSTMLDEVDRQIREKASGEQQKAFKEARTVYREELADCVRQCAWYRASLFSRWKQRGTFALCVWVAELLAVLRNDDLRFAYLPEFYLETVVDCVLSLCRSDPPFASSAILLKRGLSSFVTLVAGHFDDPRILSADLKDLLLQSLSFLVRHKDYVAAFERNQAAVERMPRALLQSFDQRSWILVANVLNHLCGGSGFGPSKHGDASSSPLFQALLREACVADEQLLASFLNRLFNTLSLMTTEFSILLRDSQEIYQLLDPQQRKCGIIFDLSCGLARILEFFTSAIPQSFLRGPDMNLRRLTELIVFVLNHLISSSGSEFFDMSLRRHGHYAEKMSRAMLLGPLVGIIVNLVDAGAEPADGERNDLVGMFASMDCPAVHCGLQYLSRYNWGGGVLRDGACLARLATLERFAGRLKSRSEAADGCGSEGEGVGECCCICYAAEADAVFQPCGHRSCFGCITRHLLNGHRCFFCNAAVVDVLKID